MKDTAKIFLNVCITFWPFIDFSCQLSIMPYQTAGIFWPPEAKNWLPGKDPDAAKDWRQEKKQKTEDETVGWHHRLKGHEFGQWVGDRQGSLVYYSPWGRKELDTTERLNWRPLQMSTHSSPSAQNPSLGQTSSELKSIITASFWVRVVHVVRHLEPVISNFHLLLECEPKAEWSTGMGFRW